MRPTPEWIWDIAIGDDLKASGIQFEYQHELYAGSNWVGQPCKAHADFVVMKEGRIQLLIETKRTGGAHSMITAIGQCLVYGEVLGLNGGQSPGVAHRSIICAPLWWQCANEIIDSGKTFGITFCTPNDVRKTVISMLESLPALPLESVA